MKENFNRILLQSQGLRDSEPEWLKCKRKEAIESINSFGFPTTRDEEWKYTPLDEIYQTKLEMPVQLDNNLSAETLESASVVNEPNLLKIILINGEYSRELSDLEVTRSALIVRPLEELIENEPEAAKFLFSSDPKETFSWLNTAMARDALLITCPENRTIQKPIHLLNVMTGKRDKLVSPRIIVKANSNSKLTLIEEFVNLMPDKSLMNAATFINAGPGSLVNHHRISGSSSGYHVGNLHCKVSQAANIFTTSLAFGGNVTRVNINVRLEQPGASCDLSGLFLGLKDELIDHHTTIEHAASETNSNEVYKGVMGGKSKGVFNGKVLVEENIHHVKASQNSNNILLSDVAEINTKPELEIYSDDVSCAHGATVGQLDADSIFYLRARGIPEIVAKKMLVEAFLEEALSQLPLESVKTEVMKIISKPNTL